MTILPIAYLPSVEYFAYLLRGDCIIDLGEHFIKRSERNRARILSPNGVLELTVQVVNANRPRTPIRNVHIDYSKRWPHQHWGALVAAYKGSPYFDYYAERLEGFYCREYDFLHEYNLALLETICTLIKCPMPTVSQSYIEASVSDFDLRPKQVISDQIQQKSSAFRAEPYIQVFCDRTPFVANLSIIDLLFAEGPASGSVLRRCLP